MTGTRVPRVALIGCGQWGRNLARNLHRLGALAAVCDVNPVLLEGVRALYPEAATTTDPETLFGDPGLSACMIATPAAHHAALAERALRAGKDVFVEKPLALTVHEGERLAELADRQGRILMVGHLLEYHPAVERLRELVATGELGKLQYVYSNRLNLGRIRTEENALWSFAPHDIHVMLRLLGELPVEVTCQGASYLHHAVADVTMSILRFASGVQGHIFVSWLHPYKDQRLVVVGDRKMAVFDDTQPLDKLRVYPHRVDWIDRVPVAVKADAESVPVPDIEPLEVECRHFLECVVTRQRPRTDAANGVEVLRVLAACQQSLERGGVPVSLTGSSSATSAPRFFAHPTATLDEGCEIGDGTHIWHYSHVTAGARIGRGCTLGQNVFVAKGVVIGDNVKIQNNVSVYEGVVLEDDVFCGPSMVFTNVLNPRSHISRRHEYRRTLVRRGATIGANATVICGVTIGQYAFVGAGAVVTRDVPDFALVYGTPAVIRGWVCRCGVRLEFDRTGAGRCPACGAGYVKDGDAVTAAETREPR